MLLYSWNINGFNTCDKYGGYMNLLMEEPDFLCLQEVKISDPDALNSLFTFGYQQYYNFAKNKGHNGVFIFAKETAIKNIYSVGMDIFDSEGRFICLEYQEFFLITVYMPHGGRKKERLDYKLRAYRQLIEFINSLGKKPVILTGDFNIAASNLDVERYKNNYDNIMFTERERRMIRELFDSGFIDTYREMEPAKRAYTWWPYAFDARKRNIGWRIDYFFVSSTIKNGLKKAYIRSDILGSDHCPIAIEIDI